MTAVAPGTLAGLLAGAHISGPDLQGFYGFGGLHGGLLAALVLRHLRDQAPSAADPIELSVHFLAPAKDIPASETLTVRHGRAVSFVAASAVVDARPVAMATGVFGMPGSGRSMMATAPSPPRAITGRQEAERFVVPPEFVPIATRMEIRPATGPLPYSGSRTPELCAWIRLTDPVPDPVERLLVLADALAPSYSAVLTDPLLVPTARLTVRFSPNVHDATFDWVLVQATTTQAGTDGWLTEHIEIWAEDGLHLASASQLRTMR